MKTAPGGRHGIRAWRCWAVQMGVDATIQILAAVNGHESIPCKLSAVALRGVIERIGRQIINRLREMIGQIFQNGVVGHVAQDGAAWSHNRYVAEVVGRHDAQGFRCMGIWRQGDG